MSDKIERLQHLLAGNKDEVGESLKDTISDLGAYCLLWLVYMEKSDVPESDTKRRDNC
jgi:hypothetical protein